MGNRAGARLFGLLILVGMLFLPVMSCGMIEFKGHELARNTTPDGDAMLAGMTQLANQAKKTALKSGRLSEEEIAELDAEPDLPMPAGLDKESSKTMFSGKHGWLHILYIGLLVLGGLVLLVGPVAPARGVVGLLGLGGWLLFLTRFEAMFESEVPAIGMSLSWEAGAYLALAGWCGLLVLGGFRNAREIWQTPHAADRYRGDPSPPAG
ncbi:MAG: hypothetical protein H6806_05700 [Planctomycetes bacterium]|nr:hypothetical protein [Planctomycetota bacterium]MCB9826008.1 hypothetical protein [Planctomycetota bacterium]MCB9829236.1 hypothetical protein [Planctomycetota bacterium]MCB9902584.1 hypothetical protein [Planctomycetota bacterium]